MSDALSETIERGRTRLAEVLRHMRGSLRGECAFTGDDVKTLRALLAEMEPVILQSAELRRTRPELAAQLEEYKSQLLELQKTVEKIRVTLIVQKTALEASRTQVSAISQWCSAFRQTS